MTPPRRGRGRPARHWPQEKAAVDAGKIVFRRYDNRRLYIDGYYATLDRLRAYPRRRVVVIDVRTGLDVTAYMFASERLEREQKKMRAWKKELGI